MPAPPTAKNAVYSSVEIRELVGEDALTAGTAQDLLGWTEPEEGKKFGKDKIDLRDRLGTTVCTSNTQKYQRVYYKSDYTTLMWAILRGEWQHNYAPIRVSKNGWVLDGKHRLAALVLAVQEWRRNPERYPFWEEEPTVDVLVIVGMEEDIHLINTIDTGKPRTLADCFYASGQFEDCSKSDISQLCRHLDHAVRLLWDRAGAKENAYDPQYTWTEAYRFVEDHPHILHCVKAIHGEDAGSDCRIRRHLPIGYAAGLMYLQSVSSSDPSAYHDAESPREDLLDLGQADKAEEFWTLLAGGAKELAAVGRETKKLNEDGNHHKDERVAILVKAWTAFSAGSKVDANTLKLDFKVGEDGQRYLTEDPILPGIDVGTSRSS